MKREVHRQEDNSEIPFLLLFRVNHFLALLCLPDGFHYERNHPGVARTPNQTQACKVFNWSKLDLHVVHILLNVTTYSITTTAFPQTPPQREKFKLFVSVLLSSGGLLLLEMLQTCIQCLSLCCDVILFACSAGSLGTLTLITLRSCSLLLATETARILVF